MLFRSRARIENRIAEDIGYDPEGAPLELSCDLGFHDTTAWWFWQPMLGGFHLATQRGERRPAEPPQHVRITPLTFEPARTELSAHQPVGLLEHGRHPDPRPRKLRIPGEEVLPRNQRPGRILREPQVRQPLACDRIWSPMSLDIAANGMFG